MSWISVIRDALDKAVGRKPDIDEKELLRSSGGTLGSTSDGHAFDPLRPAPEPDTGKGIDAGSISVASGDPEEGGELRIE